MSRWLLLLVFLSACASSVPFPPLPVPHDDLWFHYDRSEEERICFDLTLEPGGAYKYRCVSLRTLRTWVRSIAVAD